MVKDYHDYINIYGMLILTALIAYGALFEIPQKIENTYLQDNNWQKVFYKEGILWSNGTYITNLNELYDECNKLNEGSTIVLKQNLIQCNNQKIFFITITKINNSCFENGKELIKKCN